MFLLSNQEKLRRRMAHWAGHSCPRSARSSRCWWRRRPTPTRDRGPTSCTASLPPTGARWAWTPLLTPPTPSTQHKTLRPLRGGQKWLRPLDSTTSEPALLARRKKRDDALRRENGHGLDCKYDLLLSRFQLHKSLNQRDFGGFFLVRRETPAKLCSHSWLFFLF